MCTLEFKALQEFLQAVLKITGSMIPAARGMMMFYDRVSFINELVIKKASEETQNWLPCQSGILLAKCQSILDNFFGFKKSGCQVPLSISKVNSHKPIVCTIMKLMHASTAKVRRADEPAFAGFIPHAHFAIVVSLSTHSLLEFIN